VTATRTGDLVMRILRNKTIERRRAEPDSQERQDICLIEDMIASYP